jgi:hypothetical protein
MKKILLITAIAFIIVSIVAIMFTFQASSTFRNFNDDNGDNGDDHVVISNPNPIRDNNLDNIEDSFIIVKNQYFKLTDSGVFFLNIENIELSNKILIGDPRYS